LQLPKSHLTIRGTGNGKRTIDTDVPWRKLQGECAREGDVGALAGSVIDERFVALVRIHGGGVDDGAALCHVGEGVARQEELAEHVGAECALHLQGTTGTDKITEHIKLLAMSKRP
jgi:hypothetical protein